MLETGGRGWPAATRRAALSLLALPGLARPGLLAAAEPRPLRLAVFPGGLSWPVFVAAEKGFFARHGLSVAVTEVAGSVPQLLGLAEGRFDVAMTPFDNVVASQEGQGEASLGDAPDLFAFMGGISGALRLIVAREVQSFADLRGRALGVDSEITGYTLAMYQLLASQGLGRNDYRLEKLGGTASRVSALVEGRIAGTMVSSPQEIGPEEAGFRRLGDVRSMIGPYQAVCGAARRSWAAREGDMLRDFIRAYVEAGEWLADPAHRAEAAAVYVQRIRGGSEAIALKAWDVVHGRDEGFQPRARFDPRGAETVLAIRARFGQPPKALRDWTRHVDERWYADALAR